MHKQLNNRISVEFFNALIKHHTFRDNYKAISGAEYFLLEVATYNESNGGGSEIYSRKIYDVFKNYDMAILFQRMTRCSFFRLRLSHSYKQHKILMTSPCRILSLQNPSNLARDASDGSGGLWPRLELGRNCEFAGLIF
jgi:hypothetical protein